ncbi:MAG: redoxin domain-containing protein [Betaproteobacteria bacterium]|nr:redoxin domain-containing protein [Betaproteobacteria bacterium]
MSEGYTEVPLPDFRLEGTSGPFQSADCPGRLTVLYFYPKDNTPGCTTEGIDFAALYPEFRAAVARRQSGRLCQRCPAHRQEPFFNLTWNRYGAHSPS